MPPLSVLVALAALSAIGLLLAISSALRRALFTALVFGAALVHTAWLRLTGHGERALPRALRHAFETLGPSYVKLAQLIASSSGLFPERFCIEFRHCLDAVRPFSFAEVERAIEHELAQPLDALFLALDPTPLASASIAQVHAASLRDGRSVVVKVQRPAIAVRIEADLGILRWLARALERLPNGKLLNPRAIVDDYAESLANELDFRGEAANMDEFNAIMQQHGLSDVAAPEPVHALTTRRVLVMERFVGARVDDLEALSANQADPEDKLIRGLLAWFRGLLFHGFFHGDVHAGNLMALDDGRIGFLDFGIVGRFPQDRSMQVTDYLLALSAGDFEKVGRTLLAMGNRDRPDIDFARFVADLREAYGPMIHEKSANLKYADLLPAMESVSRKHRLRLPREFVLLIKQMLYFDRYAKLLAPRLNIFSDPRIIGGLAADVMRVRALAAAQTTQQRAS